MRPVANRGGDRSDVIKAVLAAPFFAAGEPPEVTGVGFVEPTPRGAAWDITTSLVSRPVMNEVLEPLSEPLFSTAWVLPRTGAEETAVTDKEIGLVCGSEIFDAAFSDRTIDESATNGGGGDVTTVAVPVVRAVLIGAKVLDG